MERVVGKVVVTVLKSLFADIQILVLYPSFWFFLYTPSCPIENVGFDF
jgi:hypothetical protein